jgi:S1-C subfamily serine protease
MLLLAVPWVFLAAGCTTLGNATDTAVIRAKDKVAPALVHIRPVKEVFASGKREEIQVVGSGFIISADGYVITNEHVAAESKLVRCVLYNKEDVEAKVVGVDPYTDVAVLKLSTSAANLPHVKLGDSSKLKAGQTVLALGSPHGLARSVSLGIVSVTDRYLEDRGDEMVSPFNTWIQTDAAINPGNSGGPLLNSNGDVIGINTMIASNGADQSSGIGFAIPINTAKAVLADLTRYGRVKRPSFGIVSYAIGPDLASQMGLAAESGILVQKVIPGGAAERAGMHGGNQQAYVGNTPIMLGGDLIVAIDGHPVADPEDVNAIIEKHQAGDTVSVTFDRGRRKITLKLILGEARG